MAQHYYSPSARGFYSSAVKVVIPQDAVEITEEEKSALLEAQSRGKIIIPGKDGKPSLRDPNNTERAAGRISARNQMLTETDWMVNRHRDELEVEDGKTTLSRETYIALQEWRAALRAMSNHPDFPNIQFPPRPAGV